MSAHRHKAHLQIPDFIRDVFLGHAVIKTGLSRRLLWNKDAVVWEGSWSDGIQIPVEE